jgi:glycopeptide antibiotics resistance protein
MLLGALVAGLACVLLGLLLQVARVATPWVLAALTWSLIVIALVTLVPANGAPGWIAAEEAQTSCSWDYGGPAPEGFWIFSGGQRMLNTALFVPAGFLLALATVRRGRAWLALPGLALLLGYSALIERAQLELTRLDRACDVTDVVDNATGALLGFAAGVVAALVLGVGARVRR